MAGVDRDSIIATLKAPAQPSPVTSSSTTLTPRRRRRATAPVPPAKAAPAPTAETLRDILTPLAALATETSVKAYAWGLRSKQLLRASMVVDLCGEVADRAVQLAAHTEPAR